MVIGWGMPGAASVRAQFFWPAAKGAWTVIVTDVVPGFRFPTATSPPETTLHGAEAPPTVSEQERNVNWERSPEETRVALW